MQEKNYSNNIQENCYDSLNKIMILGLTSLAALGTSMLFMESTETNASTLLKTRNILPLKSKVLQVIRRPALSPGKPNIVTIRSLNRLILTKPLPKIPSMSTLNKNMLNPKPSLKPITIKTEKNYSLKPKK